MDLEYSADDEAFRLEVREWLADNLTGDFAALRGTGGSGREHEFFDERRAWNKHLAASGWTCLGWPVEAGGKGLSLFRQVIFHEEYARADAPARVNHLGEELLGPTLLAYGTQEQKDRFLPSIVAVDELWCQGYSEPGAGSDLAAVRTKARLEGDEWIVDGQKVWTSLAMQADWCFVIARTEPGSVRHAGLSYLLVPMKQDGVDIRPIIQLTGTSEFNEVFFADARTNAGMVVDQPGNGWKVAMATLGFERGVSTIAQQVGFARELDGVIAEAGRTGAIDDPLVREQLGRALAEIEIIRLHALRTLSGSQSASTDESIAKLLWAGWHRRLGETAMLVRGPSSLTVAAEPYELDAHQSLYLFSRADTIYGGSDEIQRNIIAERSLGLPREPRP